MVQFVFNSLKCSNSIMQKLITCKVNLFQLYVAFIIQVWSDLSSLVYLFRSPFGSSTDGRTGIVIETTN